MKSKFKMLWLILLILEIGTIFICYSLDWENPGNYKYIGLCFALMVLVWPMIFGLSYFGYDDKK
jgi:hypothetical protein